MAVREGFGGAVKAAELVARARTIGPIRTRCTAVFSLMNTSVVVGIRAVDEGEHRKLLSARPLFDEIVPSGPFTPHITVAYYRPEAPTPLAPDALRAVLGELTARVTGTPVMLTPERLHVLHFDSMSNYWAV
ncbi:2'-5' RNA ligase family protein [Actinomyces sp. Z5]|nr:2'-5' RNA ligase family protein [Actinomyces sp. Z5]